MKNIFVLFGQTGKISREIIFVKTNNIEGGGEDVCIAPSRVGVGGRR